MLRALVIANPVAGRGRGGRLAPELASALEARGIRTRLHLTRHRGDARARAAALEPGTDLVVAVGGDGTLREVVDGLGGQDVPIGLVPAGTANVLARDLGLPRRLGPAVDVIAGAHAVALDAGRANGRLCALVVGVGLDGMVVREVERRRRGRLSRWSYAVALLRLLPRYRAPRLGVEVDGVAAPGPSGLVLISNIVHYGGFARLAPAAPDDGRFEIYLFSQASRRRLAGLLLRACLARLPGPGVELRRARRVRVVADVPVPVQIDGDDGGETPLEFAVDPRRYRLLVPRGRAQAPAGSGS